jgi:TonB-dependent receptor
VDAELIPTIRTAFGVRFEDGEQTIRPFDVFGGDVDPVRPIEEQYWLPAGTLTWNFAENMQLRLGASRTLARPQFREVAPQIYVDPDIDREFIGNPFLVDSQLVNLDARWEWYFARQQFLTAGVFFKDIDKPIEAVINEVGSTTQQTFLNAPRAILYGLELEAKKYFELPLDHPWLRSKRWLIQANYTYAKSEVRVEQGDVVFPITTLGEPAPASSYVEDGSRLQGQSDHLANIQFGFEDDAWKTQATLLLTYVSDRISARGRPGEPDFVQDPGVLLDLVVRQGVTALGRELTLGFEARNLLDEDYEEFQEAGGGRVDVNRYDLGRSFSVSLSTRF